MYEASRSTSDWVGYRKISEERRVCPGEQKRWASSGDPGQVRLTHRATTARVRSGPHFSSPAKRRFSLQSPLSSLLLSVRPNT